MATASNHPHHDARQHEGRRFEEHLSRNRHAHAHQLPHRAARVTHFGQQRGILAQTLAAVEIPNGDERHGDARNERRHARTRRSHRFETAMSEDEDPVQHDVHQVASDDDHHRHDGVAHPFEKLLEREEEHDGRHTESHEPVIGNRQVDHLGGLSHAIHERNDGQLHGGNQKTQHGVEDHGVFEIIRRTALVALREPLAHERGQPQRQPHSGDEEDEEDRAAERHGGQRQRIVAAELSHHGVVGELHQNLPHLRQHDGQGQFQIGPILFLIARKTVHRAAKIRISREKKASSLAFFPTRSIQGATEERLSREQSKFYSRLPRRSIIYRRNTAEHAPSGEPPQAPTRRYRRNRSTRRNSARRIDFFCCAFSSSALLA